MHIRPETPADYKQILRITHAAFQTLDYPGRRRMDEHYLVALLRDSPVVIPELCFVAELDGELVGHILYARTGIHRPDGTTAPTISFGPLTVLPKYHRQGIGRALVAHSFAAARALGHGAVIITGVPDYYPKLGFVRAAAYGLSYSDGSIFDAFMA
ncbi:MAG: N-acetyltransferase [Clostridiales bacterium]|nr:N-acetyltransferase [Clostridiales bacterium]